MLEASLTIVNARVVTLDPQGSYARAVAVRGKKIIAVGSNKEIRRFAGPKTKVLDAKNGTVVPGLVD
jgi:predicted amidohydrolase YtcJ